MNEKSIRFAPSDPGGSQVNLAADPKLRLLAQAIVNQQRAGFGNYADLREAHCASCGKSGFYTGWGFWRFGCGAEILSNGTESEPCGAV